MARLRRFFRQQLHHGARRRVLGNVNRQSPSVEICGHVNIIAWVAMMQMCHERLSLLVNLG
jgi:hypothetical protein